MTIVQPVRQASTRRQAPSLGLLATVVAGCELGTDLVGFGRAKLVVKGKSFVPVIERLSWVTGGMMAAGEAGPGAG